MGEYSSDINTGLYKYSQPVYITEPTGERQTFIPLKLSLNQNNFNFDLSRSDGTDFRLAETSNGTGVLQMWIAYWSFTEKLATVWFKLPEILGGEIKTLYAFWGFNYDAGVSDLRYLLGESVEGSIVYTDNLALGVSTSGSTPSIPNPDYAFDGSLLYCDIPLGGWLQCNYTTPTKINKLVIRGDGSGWYGRGFELRASNDAFNAQDVLIVDVSTGQSTGPESYFFGNNDAYYNYRVVNDKGQTYWRVSNIEMMGINEAETASTPVFLFGDDFEGSALDVNKWPTSYGSMTVSNSYISLGTDAWIGSPNVLDTSSSQFLIEDGVVGIGSPTSTSTAAHRYRFYGGENVLGIDYYWEGSTDRRHDAVAAGTYVTYQGSNRGLIIGGYNQTYFGYYEPTDNVYQGMVNRGGDANAVYSEDLATEYSHASALASNTGHPTAWLPGNAVDGTTSTQWIGGPAAPMWWGYFFDSAQPITKIIMHMNGSPISLHQIEASNDPAAVWDDKEWTLIISSPGQPSTATYEWILDFDNNVPYLYWRVVYPNGGSPYLPEIEMYKILSYDGEFDYDDNWERKVHRNTELSNFRIYGEDASSANGVSIDWIIARKFTPESDVLVNTEELYVEHEYVGHQQLDGRSYGSDVTDVNFHHLSDMGGDPYRMSDDIVSSLSNIFISDGESTSGNLVIDFGRFRYSVTDVNYSHYDSHRVEYYNASKLSDLDTDVFNRSYWQTTTTSGWAAIKFPTTKDIACLALKAKSGSTSRMVDNFKFYGSQSNPRFSGWNDKVLIYEDRALANEQEQTFYFSTGLTFYEYYILEVIDTHGGNIAIQEWGMYERNEIIGKRVISQLRLHPVAFDGNEYYFTKQIEFYGSNNGFDWDMLIPTIDTPTPFIDYAYGRWSRYSFDNLTGYYLYKLTCDDNWRAPADTIKMAEWEMVERSEEIFNVRVLAGTTDNINNIWADPTSAISSGTVYFTNEMFNTVEFDTLIHSAPIEISTGGGYWQEAGESTDNQIGGGTATDSIGAYQSNPIYAAPRAFDGSLSTYYHSAQYSAYPIWIQYLFPSKRRIVYMRMYPRNSYTSRMPGNFIIKGSNTGAFAGEETDITSIVGATYTQGTWTEFNFTNPFYFLYYRLHITNKAVGSGSGNYMNIYEIVMGGYTRSWVEDFETGGVDDFNIRL